MTAKPKKEGKMQQKIEKLTPEQESMIPKYLEDYLKIGLDTIPENEPAEELQARRLKAEKAVKDSYKFLNMPEPEIMWRDSPFQGAKLAAQLAKGSMEVTKAEIAEQADMASYGSFEAYWVAFYAFISEQLPIEPTPLIEIAKEIVKHCGVYWTFEDALVLTEKPVSITMVDGNLSNPEGKALKYKDGSGLFALKGATYNTLAELKIAAKMAQ